jgi:hypothetical protein
VQKQVLESVKTVWTVGHIQPITGWANRLRPKIFSNIQLRQLQRQQVQPQPNKFCFITNSDRLKRLKLSNICRLH